jgi:Tfp pilus assembly protein PilO
MIIDKLTKLDDNRRKTIAVLVLLAVAGAFYFTITRGSIVKLKAVKANYVDLQTVYTDTEYQQSNLSNLQKELEEKQKQLEENQQRSFSPEQASQLFENINSMALSHKLRPISKTVSEPIEISDTKTTSEQPEAEQKLLKTQSATIAVCGDYFSMVDFVNELAGLKQKIYMTNFHMDLARGEKFYPKATFQITLLIDSSKGH